MKPVIIYVSGAPGSGKTTLSRQLSQQLNIHHISSDLIHGGIAFLNPSHIRSETIKDVFILYLIATSKLGISFVVDHVLQKDIAKSTIIDNLLPHAHIIYIHTQTTDPISRYKQHVKSHGSADIQERRDTLLLRADFHESNLHNTINPIELDLPTPVVDTNDGYRPTLDEIIGFIREHSQHE